MRFVPREEASLAFSRSLDRLRTPAPTLPTHTSTYDVAIIGAGIVGLATTRALLALSEQTSIAVLEKEDQVGSHQTGRNSGVLHTGIYYPPGSLKARLCVEGAAELRQFCDERELPLRTCGKVLVAHSQDEIPKLNELLRRGSENGVSGLRKLDPQELREHEPHVDGIAALRVPGAAIVDFGAVARAISNEVQQRDVTLLTGTEVVGAAMDATGAHLETTAGTIRARIVLNCSGLHVDRVASLLGVDPEVRIVPFRGEYSSLTPEARHLVRGLVYPVPDPSLPFLGAHFTPTVQGEVKVGPNAVLALAREGYDRRSFKRKDVWETVSWSGFPSLARRNWRTAGGEYLRSFRKRSFLTALQRLVPELKQEHLLPAPAGVRAQAVARDGTLVDDFRIVESPGAVHVLNAPSPAATASLAIGRHIAGLVSNALR